MENRKIAPTTVNEYFCWLEETVNPDTELYRAAHAYLESEYVRFQQPEDKDRPFLSVITRTQGKRPAMLRETLLCLTAQSNTDFELLLMGHNLSPEQDALVSQIVSEQPEWLRKKTRVIPVNGGTRTTPLNEGFAQAKGKYIVILDDDDIAFENWVEEFYRLHLENDGKVLHTYTVSQEWETVGENTPRAIGAPGEIYCRDFKLFDELSLNVCPPGALAFPAYAFQKLGIRFDETMTTTEDWDYLMRCAFLTGVANSSEVTFLYRQWRNSESSATVHSRKEWDDNYARIIHKFLDTPVVMHKGSLHGIIDRYLTKGTRKKTNDQEVFYDDGDGFSAAKMMKYMGEDDDRVGSCFEPMQVKTLVGVRYDPDKVGCISIDELSVRVICEDDSEMTFTEKDVKINGCKVDGSLVFLKSDPQIYLKLPKPMDVKRVLVSCRVRDRLTDAEVEASLRRVAWKGGIFYRLARTGYHFLRKVKNRIKRMFKK